MAASVVDAYVGDKCKEHQDLLDEVLKSKDYIKLATNALAPEVQFVWCDYEDIDWERVLSGELRCNSYCVRKGLIRKANFAALHESYSVKYPDSPLAKGVPASYAVELHHPDDVDEALCELPASVVINEDKNPWILKLSVVEKADNAIIFTEVDQLREKLEELGELDIREFVVQEYIERPLLCQGRKFSMRAYVLAVGDLEVFLWEDVYCFLCSLPYSEGSDHDFTNRYQHITNFNVNCHHEDWSEERCSFLLPDLAEHIGDDKVKGINEQIASVCADLFNCMHAYPTVFMALPGCFELYGLDFLADSEGRVKLLETNAGPALNHLGKKYFENGVRMYDDIFKMVLDPFYGPNPVVEMTRPSDADLHVKETGGFNTKIYSKRTEYRYQSKAQMNFE